MDGVWCHVAFAVYGLEDTWVESDEHAGAVLIGDDKKMRQNETSRRRWEVVLVHAKTSQIQLRIWCPNCRAVRQARHRTRSLMLRCAPPQAVNGDRMSRHSAHRL